MSKNFSVSIWWKNPETPEGEDCCCMGDEFETESEARDCVKNLEKHFNPREVRTCPWVLLEGPNLRELTCDEVFLKQCQKDEVYIKACERAEARMQAGMLGGIDAYNDF